ncbi:protein FAM200A-like [Portunus trituberculatus]|uniref:protein FAM200A-like n=1 Tax=Portunus trituberculatus TaxID=210409 RepID=UPI001E1D1F0A|nr:protein FAM200A-like [Portunus trituberculatus]
MLLSQFKSQEADKKVCVKSIHWVVGGDHTHTSTQLVPQLNPSTYNPEFGNAVFSHHVYFQRPHKARVLLMFNKMSQKRRWYQDNYLDYGFTYLVKDGAHISQCVVCLKTFSNSIMKPSQLKQHLANAHPQLKDKNRSQGKETLLKPCIVDSERLVLGEESSQKMKQISLSNNTIKNRIAEMSEDIKENVVSKVMSSPFFSLQIDESTDVTNIAQLLAFCRYITDKGIEEEFLFCRPLEMTTKAVDVMAVVADFFEESGLNWNKLEGICTDGGPNMFGSRSRLITLVKQKQPDLKGTHSMIHREALASRTVPKNLHDALTVIINIVNYVKGSALNTRLFHELCRDMDANHTALLFHTQVRHKVDLLSAFNKEGVILGGKDLKDPLKEKIITHLDHLGDEFKRYFPGINTEDISVRLTRNPFICQVDGVLEDMQNEFLGLKHDSSAKDEFRAQNLEEFCVNMRGAYPQLSNNALKILTLFSTTYLSESGFSTLLTIKPKARNRLDVECDILCAFAKTNPDIDTLVHKKQHHPSH